MVREIGEVQEKGRIGYASHGQEKEKREREKGGQRSMLIGILFVVINLLLNCGSEL